MAVNKELLAYLDARSELNKKTGCLEGTLSVGSHGYVQGYWKGQIQLFHRLQWIARKGHIPAGMKVLHKCDNKRCRRQSHLFLGTDADNCRDKLRKGRGGYVKHAEKVRAGILNKRGRRFTPTQIKNIRRSHLGTKPLARFLKCDPRLIFNIRKRLAYADVK